MYVLALPYMALCPAHWAASVALPGVAALTMFRHPVLNPMAAAMATAAVAGKWRPGALLWIWGVGA